MGIFGQGLNFKEEKVVMTWSRGTVKSSNDRYDGSVVCIGSYYKPL